MARGVEAKLRRRNRKKDDTTTTTERQLIGVADPNDDHIINNNNITHDFGLPRMPLPPGMSTDGDHDDDDNDNNSNNEDDKDTDDDDNNNNDGGKNMNQSNSMPRQRRGMPARGTSAASSAATTSSIKGIKTLPLVMLVIMLGTTLLPAFIYAGDFFAKLISDHHLIGHVGYRLGIGTVPRRRVVSFYEKHAPEKLNDVPGILSSYYGNYPQLIKKLERKYQDYGYFVGWEDDEAPLRIAMDGIQDAYSVWIKQYWNRYAPQTMKNAARNVRYNLTYIYKKGYKLWKRHIWPWLEPIIGVPDGAEKQKRKDAADARQRQRSAARAAHTPTTRRKNTNYRDDVEE